MQKEKYNKREVTKQKGTPSRNRKNLREEINEAIKSARKNLGYSSEEEEESEIGCDLENMQVGSDKNEGKENKEKEKEHERELNEPDQPETPRKGNDKDQQQEESKKGKNKKDNEKDVESKEKEQDTGKSADKVIIENNTCRGCKKMVKTSGVICNSCNTWCHYGCERVNQNEVRNMEKYKCLACKDVERGTLKEEIKMMKKKITRLEKENVMKEERIEHLVSEKVKLASYMKEIQERIKRQDEELKHKVPICASCMNTKQEKLKIQREMEKWKMNTANEERMVKELKDQLNDREKRNEQLAEVLQDYKRKEEDYEKKAKEEGKMDKETKKEVAKMKKEVKEYQNKLQETIRETKQCETELEKLKKENKETKQINKALELAIQEVGEKRGKNTTMPTREVECIYETEQKQCPFGEICNLKHRPRESGNKRKDDNNAEKIARETRKKGMTETTHRNDEHKDTKKACYFYHRFGKCKYNTVCKFSHTKGEKETEESKKVLERKRSKRNEEKEEASTETNRKSTTTQRTEDCRYFNSEKGCKKGDRCWFKHKKEDEENYGKQEGTVGEETTTTKGDENDRFRGNNRKERKKWTSGETPKTVKEGEIESTHAENTKQRNMRKNSIPCYYYNTKQGCRYEEKCLYLHETQRDERGIKQYESRRHLEKIESEISFLWETMKREMARIQQSTKRWQMRM